VALFSGTPCLVSLDFSEGFNLDVSVLVIFASLKGVYNLIYS
jgi:hypothetical protein